MREAFTAAPEVVYSPIELAVSVVL